MGTGQQIHSRWRLASRCFAAPALLAVTLGLSACGSTAKPSILVPGKVSGSLPAGPWGRVIACLQRDSALNIFVNTKAVNGFVPGADTRALLVSDGTTGDTVAYVGDTAMGANGVPAVGNPDVDQKAGPIRFGFTSTATAAQRQATVKCVSRYYHLDTSGDRPRRPPQRRRRPPTRLRGCPITARTTAPQPKISTGGATDLHNCPGTPADAGPSTSCQFAAALFKVVHEAYAATDHVPMFAIAHSTVTGKTYLMVCNVDKVPEAVCYNGPHGTALVAILLSDLTVPLTTATTNTQTQTGILASPSWITVNSGPLEGQREQCPSESTPGTDSMEGQCVAGPTGGGTCPNSETLDPQTEGCETAAQAREEDNFEQQQGQ